MGAVLSFGILLQPILAHAEAWEHLRHMVVTVQGPPLPLQLQLVAPRTSPGPLPLLLLVISFLRTLLAGICSTRYLDWRADSPGYAVGGATQGKGGWARGPIGEQLVLAMKRIESAY